MGRVLYSVICLSWVGLNCATIILQLYQGLMQRAGTASVRLVLTILLLWWVGSGSKVARWITAALALIATLGSAYLAAQFPPGTGGPLWPVAILVSVGLFFAVSGLAMVLPTPVRAYLDRRVPSARVLQPRDMPSGTP